MKKYTKKWASHWFLHWKIIILKRLGPSLLSERFISEYCWLSNIEISCKWNSCFRHNYASKIDDCTFQIEMRKWEKSIQTYYKSFSGGLNRRKKEHFDQFSMSAVLSHVIITCCEHRFFFSLAHFNSSSSEHYVEMVHIVANRLLYPLDLNTSHRN